MSLLNVATCDFCFGLDFADQLVFVETPDEDFDDRGDLKACPDCIDVYKLKINGEKDERINNNNPRPIT